MDNKRVIIEGVYPEINAGRFPIKRVVGEDVYVRANIFAEGHDVVAAAVLYRRKGEKKWHELPMQGGVNDEWEASFSIEKQEDYVYTFTGWVDEFATWRKKLAKKWDVGQDVSVELLIGAQMLRDAAKNAKGKDATQLRKWAKEIKDKRNSFYGAHLCLSDEVLELVKEYEDRRFVTTYPKELRVQVDRKKALFSTWYEFFPRSWGKREGQHGTFKDCERILPEIARMGFDVVYLPPIHPIGTTKRKGKNNNPECEKGDPGSPWAIGGKEGGHKAIHPQLGTLKDFKHFMAAAKKHGMEVALDIAFQCSPDHPYVKEHPQWFKWRPDKTIQYAENPPKKYEDVYPINFDTKDYKSLWKELRSVFDYWIKQGVRIFRVDNPHTKPFGFWDWLLAETRKKHPDVLFLSEAFTRPKVMARLAKGGFHQSYTYFTWRTSNWDFIQYMEELTTSEMREFFRPNFWPNTPDILPYHLQHGGRPAFMMRYVLAATLSSNCGIYGPAFELCVADAVKKKEEYLYSEKYEIKDWDWDAEWNLKDFIACVNKARRENPALQYTNNIHFVPLSNDNMMAYLKIHEESDNIILVVVNLDPYHMHAGWVTLPFEELGLGPVGSYELEDLITEERYIWQGASNYVELNPYNCPAHIFKVTKAK